MNIVLGEACVHIVFNRY